MGNEDQNKEMSPLKRAFIALEAAHQTIQELERNRRQPIAIVGMGCRFPGAAENPVAYWQLLHAGKDAISRVHARRWGEERRYPKGHAANEIRGGFLDEVDTFDAEFFGISPREAICVDPQQRLLLEVAWEALEDAGISPHSLSGSATGVYIGLCKSDYGAMQRELGEYGGHGMYPLAGGACSMASGRLSYFLGLQGPSMTIDTACSSSLVALGSAYQSLQLNDCDTALVGGVSLMLSPENTLSYAKAEMMSADGRCRTFDQNANGFVQGEGCGVVVLKRLADAEASGDNIIGVIHVAAINQDGPSSGLTAPNGEAQEALIRKALSEAGLTAAEIDYVEAHGTGTSLGDPIEMRAIASVLSDGHDEQAPLRVGSVKTNIGHLESAAGMASLIKVLLSLRHECIPPHINFSEPSSFIDWDNMPVQIPTSPQDWPRRNTPRYAGISGFGFSGTNVHVIVSDYQGRSGSNPPQDPQLPSILALSARSDAALLAETENLAAFLCRNPDVSVGELIRSQNVGRSHFAARLAIVGESAAELRATLSALGEGGSPPTAVRHIRRSSATPRVAMLFTGQGSQFATMGREFYKHLPAYRKAFDDCDACFAKHLAKPLTEILYGDSQQDLDVLLENTEWQQPALFAFEYAVAKLWCHIGVVPTAVAGHSLGEYVAACVAGLLSLEDACRLVAARGRLMQALPADGSMLAVNAAHSDVLGFVAEEDGKISVAAINGPTNTVLSGAKSSIDRVADKLQKRGVNCTRLNVSHAFHSPLMEPMLAEFEKEVGITDFGGLTMSLVSNLSGNPATTRQMSDKNYWLKHIVNPVRFEDSIRALRRRGCEVFIEVGPHPVLTAMGQACVDDDGLAWIATSVRPTAKHRDDPLATLALAVARYYASGGDVDWGHVYGRSRPLSYALPTYPFQRSRYWFSDARASRSRYQSHEHPLLGHRILTPLHAGLFENELSIGDLDFVGDHVVHGMAVLPATAIIEMSLAAAVRSDLSSPQIKQLQLLDAIRVPSEGAVTLQTVVDRFDDVNRLRIFARAGSENWQLHCEAELESGQGKLVESMSLEAPVSLDAITASDFYEALFARGLNFGESLRRVTKLERKDGFARSFVSAGDESGDHLGGYLAHPAVLDACLQTMAAAVPGFTVANRDAAIYMPVSIDSIETGGALGGDLQVRAAVTAGNTGQETLLGDVEILDTNGETLFALRSIGLKRAVLSDLTPNSESPYYRIDWQEKMLSDSSLGQEFLLRETGYLQQVQTYFRELANGDELQRYFEGLVELEGIAVEYILSAFTVLGWRKAAGASFSASELCTDLGVDLTHTRLLNRFLQILCDEEILSTEGDRYIVKRDPTMISRNSNIQQVCEQWPEVRAESELLSRCGPRIADMLRGQADPLELLFPAGDTEAGAAIYTQSPLAKTFNATVAETVAAMVDGLPEGRRLRILEIGGGTGGTTRFVASRVDSSRFMYTFTDIGPLFVDRAEQRFGSDPAFKFATLNVEEDPAAQGFHAACFDLVIAANVIHATRDLDQTLANIHSLLVAGGSLLMTEVVQRLNWIDTTFGFTSGWWRFEDHETRADYPLLSVAEWQSILSRNKFTSFERITPVGSGSDANAVLLSRTGFARVVKSETAHVQARILIVADDDEIGGLIVRELADQFDAESCTGTDFIKTASGGKDFGLDDLVGIIFLPSFGDDLLVASAWSDGEVTSPACKQMLELIQILANANIHLPHGFSLLTSGACAVRTKSADHAPLQSLLLGIGKVLAIEHPELNYRSIDLDPVDVKKSAIRFARLFGQQCFESEQAFRGEAVLVPRLMPASPASPPTESADSTSRLTSSKRGQLGNLSYQVVPLPTLGEHEVRIRVRSSGLNFRDVLNALGNYSGGEVPFGSECAGTVEAVGSKVSGVSVRDSVIAVAEHAFAGSVIAKRELVALKPEHLSFDAAACFPIAFLTAHYCIAHFARLKKGESILIHAGAGGVGMACVQLAKRVGARIFATAGSVEKRSLLESMGVEATYSSRRPDFVEELMRATDGRGVNVVINSLTGDFIPASLDALSPDGRFVEIGRAEIWSVEQVAKRRDDVRYIAVDLSSDLSSPDDEMRQALADLVSDLDAGEIQALPVRAFSRDETIAAFRFMAQAQHIGKVAITAPVGLAEIIRPDASYLVTGAFGSLGRISTKCLANQGARSLVLVGRRAAGGEARKELKQLRSKGVVVDERVFDVADAAKIEDVFQACRDAGRPIAGILHCAGSLSDAPLLQQTWEDFEKVFAAKVRATWHLHAQTLSNPVDFFVSYSSIASVLGSAGQANHCAANTYMDSLALGRRIAGLPAASINWGVWSEIGAAVERNIAAIADARGLAPITTSDGIAYLLRVISSARGQTMVQSVDWSRYLSADSRSRSAGSFFANLIERRAAPATTAKAEPSRRQELDDLPDGIRSDRVHALVREELVAVLGLEKGSCPADDLPLKDAGLDSLLAVELRNALGRVIEERLPATLMFDYPTISAVSNFIYSELFPAEVDADAGEFDLNHGGLDDLFGEIEGMSDSEAAAAFKRKVEKNDHRE